MTLSVFWDFAETCSYTIYGILIPIAIYYNVKLCKENREMYIHKRVPTILYGLNISFILGIFAMLITEIAALHYTTSKYVLSMAFDLFFAAWWLLLYFLLNKNWMIFYQYFWHYYMIQLDWQQIINKNMVKIKQEHNWYITHNKKYGNVYYMYKLFGILCCIGFLFCVIPATLLVIFEFHIISLLISFFFISISLCPPIIFYIILVRKTPTFHDTFSIHWESHIHSKLLLLLAVTYSLVNISFLFLNFEFKVTIFGLPMMSLILFLMNYISSSVISKLNNKPNVVNKLALSNASLSSYSLNGRINLKKILVHKKAVHLFMSYLSTEYSMECLLSLIELNQYQLYLRQYIDDINVLQQVQLIEFASNIPTSEIVEEIERIPHDVIAEGSDEDAILYVAKMKAHKVFNKYIKIGSEFEINICSAQREQLSHIFGNVETLKTYDIDLNDLFIIFEQCKREMIKLLGSSLWRFKMHNDFAVMATYLL